MSSITLYPTTNAVGTTGFTNAGNAYSSDDSYATAAPGTLSTISSYFGGFGFAAYIPSGATINSVTVYCERKFSTTASAASSTLRPYNNTTALAAENENTTEPTTDTTYNVNFGALATADVRSADFRILVGAKRGSGATGYTYSLDMVCVTVDYTSGAYTLTCDYASFALSGQVASLIRSLKLSCTQASLTLSGQIAALLRGKKIACDVLSMYVIGQAATLTFNSGASEYTLVCEYASAFLAGQSINFVRTIKLVCANASISTTGQAITFKIGHVLTCTYASYAISGQAVTFKIGHVLICSDDNYKVSGQNVTLTLSTPGDYTLEVEYASFTITAQSISFSFSYNLSCLYRGYIVSGQSVQFFVDAWEPSGDMITLGTLLTRIQSALGDTNGAIWNRTTTVWPFACDAIRDFPILRPKTTAYTVAEAGHSFTLPADFRKLIYVEFPPYQDPPQYLQRKGHLGTDFFGEDGYCDLDRDYDSGGDYMLWVSNNLIVGDIVIVRYLATHTTEFANEYSYITIENQYVQVIINHVVMMCYQERLALQLQDPTAHTSTIQQMSDAVKTAEANYLDLLKRAQQEIANSQRVAGWKVDKHDRIY